MFQPELYLPALIALLKEAYRERLLYVGLQGSYLRNEATEHSDLDIMVVISAITTADLDTYRAVISTLEDAEKSCGFICGAEELQNWNPLEICHLVHTTKDYYGTLSGLIPAYTREDVRSFVKMSLGNLYHELCHRYIHASREKNVAKFPVTCRSVFFILQNKYYLETGHFIGTKKELCSVLSDTDRAVLELSLAPGCENDFDRAFELLFTWCRDSSIRI